MALVSAGRRIAGRLAGKKTMGTLFGAAALAGVVSERPLEPASEFVQNQLLGDPNGIQTMTSASIATRSRDLFRGDDALDTLQGLRSPVQRPKDFNPPGSIVFGMWNSRMGRQ